MRVLEVIGGEYGGGGQEQFAIRLTKNLIMEGIDAECLIPYAISEDVFARLNEQLSQRMHSLDVVFDPAKSVNEIYGPFKRFLRDHQYDIVHIHSSRITMMSMMSAAAKRAGVAKVIVHSHNTEPRDSIKHHVLRFLGGVVMARYVDTYCACSRAAADWKFTRKRANSATIIKNSIDVEQFRFDPEKRKAWREKLGIPDETWVIGNVGRLSYQKNQMFLIDLMDTMKQDNCILLLVGEGEDREKIERRIEERQVRDKCLLVGKVDNVQDYMQAMDVFAMPSRYEGFVIAAIEAQASGLPCLLSEQITKEVDLCPDVRHLPIARPELWAEALKKMERSVENRMEGADVVKQAGYNEDTSEKYIRSLYDS